MFALLPHRFAAVASFIVLAVAVTGCKTAQTVPLGPPVAQNQRFVPSVPTRLEPGAGADLVPIPPPPSEPQPTLVPPVEPGGKTVVALLLPLSGPSGPLGRDMLDAAQLALHDLGDDHLALAPKDTKGTADGAADAARRAVAEGVRLVIGPLTAAEVEAVKPVTGAAGLTVLAFSNVTKVAGGGVFLMGFQPAQEVTRIVGYAKSTGVNRYAVLAPANAYGQVARDALTAAVSATNGTVEDVRLYDPGSADVSAAARGLVPVVRAGVQAVLLPEPVPAKLRSIAGSLPMAELVPPKVRPLGTSSWEAIGQSGEPNLVGGWYASPDPDARVSFEQRFAETFTHKPQRLSTLAYDAVGVAALLSRSPGDHFSAGAVTNPSGFAGADGLFRFLPDGTVERGLAVLQIERSGVSVLSPAPESFQGSGL